MNMEFELIFSERAEEDAKVALYYYDHINPDLGMRFLGELLDTYKKLAATPQYYSFISSARNNNLRDVKLPSFPYVVIFEIQDKAVNIIAVMNTSQKPLLS